MRRISLALPLACLLSISLLAPFGESQQNSRVHAGSGAASTLPAAAKAPSDTALGVSFKDGWLSVDSQARSLQSLADQISAKTGVAVILDHAVASQSVSVSFQGLALDEGLRRIFKNNDAFYFYGSDKGEPPALKVVWVYAKGKARGLQPVPPDKWASTKELERLLTDPDPQVRGWAIETLVERNREAALRQVLNSLKDNDDQVRTRALYGATVAGVPVPEGVLNNLALSDPSADVRFLALQGLSNSNSPDARQIAQHALNDPSEPVRLEGREIITRLDEEADQSQQRTPSSADQQQSNQSPQNL